MVFFADFLEFWLIVDNIHLTMREPDHFVILGRLNTKIESYLSPKGRIRWRSSAQKHKGEY